MRTACFFIFLSAFMLFASCSKNVENLDGNSKIAADFRERCSAMEGVVPLASFVNNLDGERLQAMQFLYAYMPLPDVADYTPEFYLQNVDCALRARATMPWGKSVPIREFLHFVLPVRVNNEDMDSSRVVFFNELKERVCSLSMRDAVLEVNHWCHEKVTYTPSDIRTSSPLATVRTAYGRCGEESTFTVAALRAVGIPARQVYTPRWAHTDDNHAWVEAWVDGKWHFLGACEPEPHLDLAWFNAPASRGMLMHTKAFGSYDGPEEVVGRTPCYTEINVTANYAPTAPVTVRVVDEQDNPVSAAVEYKIYNYAEFFTAATIMSNADGYATLSTGKGSLLVWAAKNGKFGFAPCTAGSSDTIIVKLDKSSGYTAGFSLDIIPPRERNTAPVVTPDEAAVNARRLAVEDSIRNAYVGTFISDERAATVARMAGADENVVVPLFKKSRGNYVAIAQFLVGLEEGEQERALALLTAVADKDLRDANIEVLRDHLTNTPLVDTEEYIYNNYLLNPRVANEKLTPYKGFFATCFSPDEMVLFAKEPQRWVEWCRKNIMLNEAWNPLSLCMSPRGVWEMRLCDSHSRNIFFVSGARSMGIPARIDAVTGKTQYYGGTGEWVDVVFDTADDTMTPKGLLKALFTPTTYIDNPRYYSHFTLSKIVDGRLQLQNYAENDTWQSLLRRGTPLDVGDYLLVTGTRMADGSVLANLSFFSVGEGDSRLLQYVQRESAEELQVIGNFNSENIFYDIEEARQRSLLSATGRGYYIIAIVAPGSEPVNHFLRDLAPYKNEFEEWGQKIVLLFRNSDDAARFVNDFPALPSTIVWGTDVNDKIYEEIVSNMKLVRPNAPVILVADTFNRVVYLSQGYSIGLGERLVKVVKMLSE